MITGQLSVPEFHRTVVTFTHSSDCCLSRCTFSLALTCVFLLTVRQCRFQWIRRSVSITATWDLYLHWDTAVGLVKEKTHDIRLKINLTL
jgi:hypothetical protein